MTVIPKLFSNWLQSHGWRVYPHQLEMVRVAALAKSALLIAPTGAGKTLAGFLPSLIDLDRTPSKRLHTLYVSPLKALTNDIERNLSRPIREMGLKLTVDSRTGDTPASRRARQVSNPPNILLTTPESLALLLSYPDAFLMFSDLKTVVIDEIHTFVQNKRGDQTALLLERLKKIVPHVRMVGLSATIAHPEKVADWLGKNTEIVVAEGAPKPDIKILYGDTPLPVAGHYPAEILAEVYDKIAAAKASIIFVNTRAQSEYVFQRLWDYNSQNLPIALHHGSITKDQRVKVEAAMARGEIRAVVATASLDLGIDWGDVSLVVNIGAPKGISRLLQRVGRSNHRLNEPSEAWLVPTNRFEVLECVAALEAVAEGKLDDPPPNTHGGLDVLCQHILNCACSEAFDADDLYDEITRAYPYRLTTREQFDRCLLFVRDGGYALKNYERFHRIKEDKLGNFLPANAKVVQRHRMNIGTIVEAEMLKVVKISKNKKGQRSRAFGHVLGQVEERLIMNLERGDTFFFAGQVLRFEGIRDMNAEVTAAPNESAKIPAFSGGRMPLSTYLAQKVRALMNNAAKQKSLPSYIRSWIGAQKKLSMLPPEHGLLVETFAYAKLHYMVAYPFAGRDIHQTLGFVLTNRMEALALHPLGFTISDYGISIWSLKKVTDAHLQKLWSADAFEVSLDKWIHNSSMLKRHFRKTAVISGLIERKLPGAAKTGKQVTFSSDLIYDVLSRFEPEHILLKSNRIDAEQELAEATRVIDFLHGLQGKIIHKALPRISPFAIPVVLEIVSEGVAGIGGDMLLGHLSLGERAEQLYDEALNG